jgi:hypothetical protein
MNSAIFSSDEMLNQLNERAFNLSQEAIVKEANAANMDSIDPLNGINLR